MKREFRGLWMWYNSLFKGVGHAVLKDQFGEPWIVVCELIHAYVWAPISLLIYAIMDLSKSGPVYSNFESFDELKEATEEFMDYYYF